MKEQAVEGGGGEKDGTKKSRTEDITPSNKESQTSYSSPLEEFRRGIIILLVYRYADCISSLSFFNNLFIVH